MRYNITGGDVNTFYIHPSSGQIFLRRTVFQDHRDNYTLTVTAADQDGKVDTAKISVSITYLKLDSTCTMSVKTKLTVSFFSFTKHLTFSALYAEKYLFKHVVDGK